MVWHPSFAGASPTFAELHYRSTALIWALSTASKMFFFLLPQIIEDGRAQEDFSALLAARFDQRSSALLNKLPLEQAFSIAVSSHDLALCTCELSPPMSAQQP
jgi:hypothetical protein